LSRRSLALLAATCLAGGTPAFAQAPLPPTVSMGQPMLTPPVPTAHPPGQPGKPPVNTKPISGNEPVTFLADSVSYDRLNGIVSATGHVQAWQNDHYLAADRVTFDRNTGVAAAYGHVVIVEPDGQVIFGRYAEVSGGMKNGVITGMSSILANGGKLAANGARRVEGKLNELSRGVYTSCNACKLNPDAAPIWQIRADHMTQDLEHKRIEYSDAWIDFYGFPVLYLPWMSNTDPSVKRQSGFLSPAIGTTSEHLGPFATLPYFWVIDESSDLLITPMVNTEQGGQLELTYRQYFNNGRLRADGGLAQDEGHLQGYIQSSASFYWNDTWRYGANVNLATSAIYMRDYMIPGYGANFIGSNVYVEGFGVGSYSRLSGSVYQGLNSSISSGSLPYVLPRYTYDFFSEPDFLGGRWNFTTQDFNVFREQGTDVRRAAARLSWDRFFTGYLGEKWDVTAEVRGAAYNDTVLNQQPNYGTVSNSSVVHAQPQVSVKLSWPFVRFGENTGTQIIEPIAQVIAAPQAGLSLDGHIPNEDSLDYEFTDSTLFALNRFGGYDRFDGGVRGNFGLHTNWTFPSGQVIDTLVGASLIEHVDWNQYPIFTLANGFDPGNHLSDIVGRVNYTQNKWVNFTARARVDHNNGDLRFGEGTVGVGRPILRLHFGYLYDSRNPYDLYLNDPYLPANYKPGGLEAAYFTPRNEVTAGASTHFGHWTLAGSAMRNLETGSMDGAQGDFKYEDECTIFDFLLARRYTSILGDHGNTTILFTITLKTVGQFGFK
jgi:LPS-assembly protein